MSRPDNIVLFGEGKTEAVFLRHLTRIYRDAIGNTKVKVALNIGFPNAQHFSRRFRKLTGQSPSAFRKIPRRRFGELYPDEE